MSWTQERARVAVLTRHRPADDPELIEARRNLKALRLEDHVKAVVDSAPPLTAAQRDRIHQILHGAPIGGGAE